MIRVVVESPFGRNVDGSSCTPEQYARNIRYLNRALLDSIRRGDEAPYASHRFYPGLLDDTNPEDRKLGMKCGLVWSEPAHRVAVYQDHGVTEGMMKALVQHHERGIEIVFRSIGAEPDLAPLGAEVNALAELAKSLFATSIAAGRLSRPLLDELIAAAVVLRDR